ncbi:hypothetical protein [Methylobacterium variabile]|jgi:hypothetical protein|uniref:hypothetical protein n=1 Tax=Methylobacterium variabile TaxID=298794 RepID=UPI0012ED18C9|nr:hypothetical protein [Methylobacterium variabile]
MTGIDAGQWADVAQRIGLGGAVTLILTIGLAIGLATRGPEFLKALNGFLETILAHRRESRRITEELERDRKRLEVEFEEKGIRRLEAPQDINP